jgi:hypothetical protein
MNLAAARIAPPVIPQASTPSTAGRSIRACPKYRRPDLVDRLCRAVGRVFNLSEYDMANEPSVTAASPPLQHLRRFMRLRRPSQGCELCSAELQEEHEHLLDVGKRELLCACYTCAVLLSGHGGSRYRRIPQRIWQLRDFALSDQMWTALNVPSRLAFFVIEDAPQARVRAIRPSRAGASESRPALEIWQAILAENPVLRRLKPEVEALLVNRLAALRDYYLVPVDICYRLVGLIRTQWRGLSGGSQLWSNVERFFVELRERSEPLERSTHA